MFAVIFICGNLFLQIAGKIAKKQKLEPAKISCHKVVPRASQLHGLFLQKNFF